MRDPTPNPICKRGSGQTGANADGQYSTEILVEESIERTSAVDGEQHSGGHRIRHYGLLAGTAKADRVAKARELLAVPTTEPQADEDVATEHVQQCPCCGGRMVVIETFAPGCQSQHRPTTAIRIDTS